MKNTIILLLLTGALLLSTKAYSRSEPMIRCDSCVSYANFVSAAEDSFKYYMPGTYSAKIVNTFTYEIRIVNVIGTKLWLISWRRA